MKVKCLNVWNLIEPTNQSLLAVNNEYELCKIESSGGQTIYWIIDDTGSMRFYDSLRFSPTFEELRDIKINQILI